MKKVIIIISIVALMLTAVACGVNNTDTAKKIEEECASYDWSKANDSTAKTKAESFIARINKLSATEQQELKGLKVLLTRIASGSNNTTPTTTPSASPSTTPSTSPSSSPSALPSTNPSASTSPSAGN